jgi:VanZ family protein
VTSRRVPRAAVLVWLAMYVAIAIGSLLPAGDLPPPAFDGIDKLQHLACYALLSGWSVLLFGHRALRLRAMLVVVAFGSAVEIAQGLLTASREPDAVDAVANAIGAVLGQLLALTPLAGRLCARA